MIINIKITIKKINKIRIIINYSNNYLIIDWLNYSIIDYLLYILIEIK